MDSKCRVDRIKNIDFSTFKPVRAGVIVYTFHKHKTFFILGIDTKSGDVTDFAGGVSFKKEDPLSGGLRELMEESLGIFGNIRVDEIINCISVYDKENLIIFVPINIDINSKIDEFSFRVKHLRNPEVIKLKILSKKDFVALIDGNSIGENVMYDRIRNLLLSGKNSHNLLRSL